jgi:hypothetical protein
LLAPWSDLSGSTLPNARILLPIPWMENPLGRYSQRKVYGSPFVHYTVWFLFERAAVQWSWLFSQGPTNSLFSSQYGHFLMSGSRPRFQLFQTFSTRQVGQKFTVSLGLYRLIPFPLIFCQTPTVGRVAMRGQFKVFFIFFFLSPSYNCFLLFPSPAQDISHLIILLMPFLTSFSVQVMICTSIMHYPSSVPREDNEYTVCVSEQQFISRKQREKEAWEKAGSFQI